MLVAWSFPFPVTAVDVENVVKNYVSMDQARTNAHGVLLNFVPMGPLSDSEAWKEATINETPITIYDPNGLKLYYLFAVEQDGTPIGEIEVSASKVLRSPVPSVNLKPHTWDFDQAQEIAKKIAAEKYPHHTITSIKPVDYAPSRIGAMAELSGPENNSYERIVVDAHTFTIIPEDLPPEAEGRHGAVCVESLYDTIPDRVVDEYVAQWNEQHEGIQSMIAENNDVRSSCADITNDGAAYKELSGFSLFGQEKTYYCMPATGQMIADYFGVTHTQDHIAGEMGTTPTGSFPEGMVAYFSGIVPDGLGRTGSEVDWSPTFSEVWQEIYHYDRPVASSVDRGSTAHTRACVGYLITSTPRANRQYIFDPLPVDEGSKVWEDTATVEYLDNVYVGS